MFLRFCGKRLQEFRLCGHHAHVPRHRFHDDTGYLVANLVEKFLHARHIVVLERKRVLCEIGRNALAARLARREHARARLDKQAIAMAVVATLEFHNLVASGKTACCTDGAHRRLGAAVHHADHLDARHKTHHEFCKFRFEPARCTKTESILRRLGNRIDDRVMSVSQKHRAPATHIVDIVVAIDIVDVAALRASDKRRRRPHVAISANGTVHATRHERLGFCEKFFT